MTITFVPALAPVAGSRVHEFRRAAGRHMLKLSRVVEQIRARDGSKPVSFRKKAVSHQVPKRHDKRHTDDKIDIGDLDEILEIDPEAMTCTAEPGVTFVKLVEATLAYGLVPIVVPELKTITIGGAVSGCSLESMSFKYGGFHDGCFEYEVVTASGEVLRCTPINEHRLIFQMMHGSFGTLGVLSKLKFRLVPAKPFVRMQYERYATLEEYKAAIWRRFVDKDVDFMDGIIHSSNEYVLSLGRFVDHAPYTNRYDWMKVYYRSTARRKEDYLTTPDYFFRYDRGVTNVHPKTFLGRLLFGKLMDSATLLRLAEKFRHVVLPKEKPDVTVDLFIPFSKLDAFMSWYRSQIDFFPLWCVPYRRVRDYEWLAPEFLAGIGDELFVDLAIYGLKQPNGRNYYKEIEDALAGIGAIKTLISYNYYDEATFWRIWNKGNYLAVKKITDPNNLFRDLYSKTCRAARGLDDPRVVDSVE
jgi:FAD binding domain-containing protein